MPLTIFGIQFKDGEKALEHIIDNAVFKDSSARFCQEPVKAVPSKKLLYVHQREFAVVSPDDEYIEVMGTDDATTCHMIVIRHTGSGVTSLAHCDGNDTESAITEMVNTVTEMSKRCSGRLEVHIVGGFSDDGKESKKLSTSLIDVLISCSKEVHLQTACITNLNDKLIRDVHFPAITGIGVHVETGHIFPATFQDKGPEMDVRTASLLVDGCSKMLNIYESWKGVLKVGPYSWKPMVEAAMLIMLPDSAIRGTMSSSPAQEPPHFEQNMRAALKVCSDHPQPQHTLFSDGQPHCYLIQPNGRWKPLDNGH